MMWMMALRGMTEWKHWKDPQITHQGRQEGALTVKPRCLCRTRKEGSRVNSLRKTWLEPEDWLDVGRKCWDFCITMEMGKAEMCRNEWGAACDDTVNLVFDKLGLKCFEDIQIKDAQQAFKTMPANPRREYWLWHRYRCRDAELTHPGRLHSFLSFHGTLPSLLRFLVTAVGMQSTACHMQGKGSPAELCPQPTRGRVDGSGPQMKSSWIPVCVPWTWAQETNTRLMQAEWGHPGKSHIVEARYQKVKLRKICWNLLSKI